MLKIIGELIVHLVGNDQKIELLRYLRDRDKFLFRIRRSRRIAGIIEEHRLHALLPSLLDFLGCYFKSLIRRRNDLDGLTPRQLNERRIRHKAWFMDENFFAAI